MNKADLVSLVSVDLNISKAEATRIVEAVIEGIATGVERDERVSLSGFGTFRKKKRKPRRGVNPSTKEHMTIPASMTVTFAASQALKDRMNEYADATKPTEPTPGHRHQPAHETSNA